MCTVHLFCNKSLLIPLHATYLVYLQTLLGCVDDLTGASYITMILLNFSFMIYGVSHNPVPISINFRIVVYLEH
jgi:hypothetical protein